MMPPMSWGDGNQMDQIYQLIKINILSFLNKLRYNWARESVAVICSGIMVAVFWYMIQDFLEDQVIHISIKMYQAFKSTLTTVSFLLMGIALARSIQKYLGNRPGIVTFAMSIGESDNNIFKFIAIQFVVSSTAVILGTVWITDIIFEPASHHLLLNVVATITGTLIGIILPKLKTPSDKKRLMTSYSMFKWRIFQILRRNPTCRSLIAIAILCSWSHGFIASNQLPNFLHGLLAFLLSIIGIIPLAIQLKEDLNYAWAEKLMGVSHKDIMKTYFKLAISISSGLSLSSTIAYIIGAASVQAGIDLSSIVLIWIITSAVIIQSPCFFFQLEPRSVMQTGLALTIINLFQVTALIFHPASVIGVIVVGYYSANYQHNRYYRS